MSAKSQDDPVAIERLDRTALDDKQICIHTIEFNSVRNYNTDLVHFPLLVRYLLEYFWHNPICYQYILQFEKRKTYWKTQFHQLLSIYIKINNFYYYSLYDKETSIHTIEFNSVRKYNTDLSPFSAFKPIFTRIVLAQLYMLSVYMYMCKYVCVFAH